VTLKQKKVVDRSSHLALGEQGEEAAVRYLEDQEAYRIVARRFSIPLGRGAAGQRVTGEIDVVAYDGDCLVFVEVKTRTSTAIAMPERAVGLRKQRQIARAAKRYRQLMKVDSEPYRYDVVAVLVEGGEIEVELIRGYFDDSVFHRGRYFRTSH
jgi:putative endonuclease